MHYRAGRYSEALGWHKRALDEATEYTTGTAHYEAVQIRGILTHAIDEMDPTTGCAFCCCLLSCCSCCM
jgi:hypothetical protein